MIPIPEMEAPTNTENGKVTNESLLPRKVKG